MRRRVLAVLAVIGLLFLQSVSHRMPVRAQELPPERPTIAPDLTPLGLPGTHWSWEPLYERHRTAMRQLGLDVELASGKGEPEAVAQEQLKAAKLELAQLATWPPAEFETGVAQHVLRLSPPGAPMREVVILRGKGFGPCSLYLLEQHGGGWSERSLGLAETTAIVDVSGDGQPEIVGAGTFGSGHFLAIQVWAWDPNRFWKAFEFGGIGDSGPFGLEADPTTGTRRLWVEMPAGPKGYYGLFTELPSYHGPFLKERQYWRWADGTFQKDGRYRLATPFYHLNRFLDLAAQGDWEGAAKHLEPGAMIDKRLIATLGSGPFHASGLSDRGLINGRGFFQKGEAWYYVDFGPTGRVLQMGEGAPGKREVNG